MTQKKTKRSSLLVSSLYLSIPNRCENNDKRDGVKLRVTIGHITDIVGEGEGRDPTGTLSVPTSSLQIPLSCPVNDPSKIISVLVPSLSLKGQESRRRCRRRKVTKKNKKPKDRLCINNTR